MGAWFNYGSRWNKCAYLGSKSAIKIGDKLIRPILVVVSILLSLRILTS